MDISTKLRLINSDRDSNIHILTVDGLFAGFSFAGIIEIVAIEKISLLLAIACITLTIATLLFAMRITIAIRVVYLLQIRHPEIYPCDYPAYVSFLHFGRRLEFAGIVLFWLSLIPMGFHMHPLLGIIIFTIVLSGLAIYVYIVIWWKRLNHLFKNSTPALAPQPEQQAQNE